jgi:hypothetical protein
MRTVPVNHSAGPFIDGWDPFRLISMSLSRFLPHTLTNGNVMAATAVLRTDRLVHSAGDLALI